MSEIKRTGLQVAAVMCFLVGLILFLSQTSSGGEAPETFRLILSFGPISIAGAAVALAAAAVFIAVSWGDLRGKLKHR